MATKPSNVTLSSNSIDILNTIRSVQSYDYQDRVPIATQDNLKQVASSILSSFDLSNAFINTLVNRIALVLINSKLFNNPLREFKRGTLEYGEFIEELFVNIAKAHQFDPAVAENEVFKREIPDVSAYFHKMNYQNFYKVTISNEQLRQAFLTQQGISDLIGRIVDSLYSGANYDEFIIMKQMIAEAAQNGDFYSVTIPAPSADTAKEIVTSFKSISNMIEFPSTMYNAAGVLNWVPKDRQILLISAELDALIDVEVLASAFNMSKAEFMGRRVLVDNFGDAQNVYAAIVDSDWFMVFDNQINFTENYNGQGLYWNYFYHVWKTFSYSKFAPAILFTTSANTVTGVTVSPDTATVARGNSLQLTANVATTGFAPQIVTWSVTGSEDVTSTISSTGKLIVAANEANTTLTVTATSDFDPSKSGTSTITVS